MALRTIRFAPLRAYDPWQAEFTFGTAVCRCPLRWYQASMTFSAREMASRRSPETVPIRGAGVCTVQTHWSRPGAILTAYSMCLCSISFPSRLFVGTGRALQVPTLAPIDDTGLCTIAQISRTGPLYLGFDTPAYRLDQRRRSE